MIFLQFDKLLLWAWIFILSAFAFLTDVFSMLSLSAQNSRAQLQPPFALDQPFAQMSRILDLNAKHNVKKAIYPRQKPLWNASLSR